MDLDQNQFLIQKKNHFLKNIEKKIINHLIILILLQHL